MTGQLFALWLAHIAGHGILVAGSLLEAFGRACKYACPLGHVVVFLTCVLFFVRDYRKPGTQSG